MRLAINLRTLDMNAKKPIASCTRLLAGVLVLGLCVPNVWAKGPDPLPAAIESGSHLFTTDTFGGKGMTCQSCHSGGGKIPGQVDIGGKMSQMAAQSRPVHQATFAGLANGSKIPSLSNAAAIFPRFSPKFGKVITLEDQIRGCIAGGLGGKPPAYGSQKLN
ncbi:Cytochrome c-like protein, partial [mine drainage metagenome]